MSSPFVSQAFKVLILLMLVCAVCATAAHAQDDLKIQRTTDMKMPGIETPNTINNPSRWRA